jgi:hypothetical protein
MSPRLIVRLEAEADVTEAAVWYETRDSGSSLTVSDGQWIVPTPSSHNCYSTLVRC